MDSSEAKADADANAGADTDAPGRPMPAGFAPPPAINARQMWANNRFWMETQNLVTKRYGGKRKQHWYALLVMMKAFQWGLSAAASSNAASTTPPTSCCATWTCTSPDLPAAFHDFTILHVSDPHFDGMAGIEDRIVQLTGAAHFRPGGAHRRLSERAARAHPAGDGEPIAPCLGVTAGTASWRCWATTTTATWWPPWKPWASAC